MSMLPPLFSPEHVLALTDVTKLISRNFDRLLIPEEVTHIYRQCDAFWEYDGNPDTPHVRSLSGLHLDWFMNSHEVLSHTNLCQLFAHQAIRVVRQQYDSPIAWALGSSTAASDFSKDVANALEARHDVFGAGPKNEQIWKGPLIGKHEVICQFEELMNRATATNAVRAGLRAAHPYELTFAPFMFTIIHRSEIEEIEGARVLSLARYPSRCWEAKDCPLCKQGSEAIPAKGTNWQRLKKGYIGEPCSECGQFTVVRCGVAVKCNSCGATSGCS